MVGNKSRGRGERGTLQSASIGALVSLAVSIIANAIVAWLVVSEKIQQRTMGYASLAVIGISVIIGSFIAIRATDGKYMLTASITGVIFLSVLLLVNVFCYGGEFHGILVTAIVIVALCISTALLTSGMGKNTKKKGKRSKYR